MTTLHCLVLPTMLQRPVSRAALPVKRVDLKIPLVLEDSGTSQVGTVLMKGILLALTLVASLLTP